jgi:hypothetical protein
MRANGKLSLSLAMVCLGFLPFGTACSSGGRQDIGDPKSFSSAENVFVTRRNEFQKIAEDVRLKKITLSQKEQERLFREISEAAAAVLREKGVQVRQTLRSNGKPIVEVSQSGSSPTNQAAAESAKKFHVKLVYNPETLFNKVWAVATFDPLQEVIDLPHSFILDPNPKDDVLQHELIHALGWEEVKMKRPSPYAGVLSGDPFQPAFELNLDEMRAYHHDLQKKVEHLRSFVSSEPRLLAMVRRSRLREIIQSKLDEKPVELGKMNELEKRINELGSTIMFGKWHTEPVIQYLPYFIRGEGELTLQTGENQGEAILGCKIHVSGKGIGLAFYKTQAPFSKNEFLMHTMWILRVANQHEVNWKRTEKELKKILSGSPEEQAQLIATSISLPTDVDAAVGYYPILRFETNPQIRGVVMVSKSKFDQCAYRERDLEVFCRISGTQSLSWDGILSLSSRIFEDR